MKKTLMILLGIGLLASSPVLVSADTTGDGSDFLVYIGERHLQKGQVKDAIHEFSKALLLNPTNQKARDYLAQYGLDDGLYSEPRTRTSDMIDLAARLKANDEKVRAMMIEQEVNNAQMQENDEKRYALAQQLKQKSAEAALLQGEMEDLQQALSEEEAANLARKDQAINHDLDLALATHQAPAVDEDCENELLLLTAKYNKLREENIVNERRYYSLHSRVEDYVRVRNQAIESYQDEIIDNKLNLLDTQHHLISTLDDTDHYMDLLQLQRERVDSQHDTIKQNNDRIEALEAQIK